MYIDFTILFVSLVASILGAITGIGGGVIIKPVIDAFGVLDVTTISFLSGCSVLSMSTISSIRNRKLDIKFDKVKTLLLAVGSIIGGILGKSIFDTLKNMFSSNLIGAYQSAILFILTLLVLIYTINKEHIKGHIINSRLLTIAVGMVLGLASSFLGIGGGPINIMFLSFFFLMDSKTATVNSIYIIMLSQISNIIFSIFRNTIPVFEISNLFFIIFGGVCGGLIGSSILKRISLKSIDKVFDLILIIVSIICVYNFWRFI